MTTLYGIKNCDTVRKARRWLDGHGIAYQFHDLRQDGLQPRQLRVWVKALGWENLLNRRGTTWRRLPAETRDAINAVNAAQLMLEQPTLIKRPVLEHDNQYHVGFGEAEYEAIFTNAG